jgi:cytosine/adenosine deaminase-related metal-dependent hydrolase
MAEMARCGTTCFVSPNVDPRDDLGGISAAAGAVGIRSVLCRFTSPRPGPDSREAARAAVDAAVRHMEPWQGAAGGLVSVWFGLDVPRRPGDTVHPEFYREVAAESRRAGVGISYHFASEVEDADYMVKTFGLRPAEWSQRHHALGPNVLLINGCWVDATDIRILVETGTHLSHSPVANTKMATGILPVGEVLAGGVNLCIGTDGGLNNNTHDMFGEMKAACLLQNIVRRSAAALTPEAALEMATIAGARAIGRERELGSLEAGKLADIVLVDLRRTHVAPVHGVVSSLVFAAGRGDVDTVIVGGRVVVRAGRVLGADEAELCRRAQERAEPLRRLLGRRGPGAWPGDRPE